MTKIVFGVEKLMGAATTTGPTASVRVAATHRVFQANLNVGLAPASAVVDIEVSLDNQRWLVLATVSLDDATPVDGFTSSATWPFVRANLKSISGQCDVDVFVGV